MMWAKQIVFHLPSLTHPGSVQDLLIGEMTGGDRALISSLEGLEDLHLIGELQLDDHGIGKDDLVFAVTEGTIFLAHPIWPNLQ